jgi:hypothetical protein
MLLNAGGQRDTRDADHADGRDIESGNARTPIDSQPNLPRVLRAQAMEPKRRQKTDDASGHTLGDLGQRVVLARGEGGGRIETAPEACQLALLGQPSHLLGMQASRTSLR